MVSHRSGTVRRWLGSVSATLSDSERGVSERLGTEVQERVSWVPEENASNRGRGGGDATEHLPRPPLSDPLRA